MRHQCWRSLCLKMLKKYFRSIFSVQNGWNWWNWSFRCQSITFASILHGKILFRRLFRMLSLWFTQMHHNASNKWYRSTFISLSARIDRDRTNLALYGRKSNKLRIWVTHFTWISLESVSSIFYLSKISWVTFWLCQFLPFWLEIQSTWKVS